MEATNVRRLTERDIDAAIALTDLEHWGYTRADFRRLLTLSPDGCFVAESNGRVVGVLATTSYGGLAYLGAVIVTPELRGRGVGKAMMQAALDYLRSTGVRTVRLYAYLNVIPFYEGLGFRREYEVIRWHGPPGTSGGLGTVRPVRWDDLESLAKWDEPYFGSNRGALLSRLADEVPSTFLISERRGAIQGYIVGNPSGDSCELGPWVVTPGRAAVARDLFHSVVLAAGVSEVAFNGPSRNEDLLEFVRERRSQEVFRNLRMVWGADEFAGDPRGVWAFGGLEKG